MDTQSIHMMVEWTLPPERARSVSDALHALALESAQAPVSLECRFPAGGAHGVVLRYIERWLDEDHLRHDLAHGRLTRLAELIEQAGARASVTFNASDAVHGIEYVEHLLERSVR
jgi:hypothetical protein